MRYTLQSQPRTGNRVEPSAHRFWAEGSDKRVSAQYLRPNIQPIYHFAPYLGGKLGEGSDKLGPIVGNQAESSDRRATIRPRSGLSLTAGGNLYCSFLLKNGLLSCKTSDLGNLSEDSHMKHLGESSDTEDCTKDWRFRYVSLA